MQKNNATLVIVCSLAGFLVAGCGTTLEQHSADASQERNAQRTEYDAEWQSFRRESERTIQMIAARIEAFKEKMEMAGSDTKARYCDDVSALERKNRELKKRLEGYKDQGRDAWEMFKNSIAQDMDGMGKTMKDLFNDSH